MPKGSRSGPLDLKRALCQLSYGPVSGGASGLRSRDLSNLRRSQAWHRFPTTAPCGVLNADNLRQRRERHESRNSKVTRQAVQPGRGEHAAANLFDVSVTQWLFKIGPSVVLIPSETKEIQPMESNRRNHVSLHPNTLTRPRAREHRIEINLTMVRL